MEKIIEMALSNKRCSTGGKGEQIVLYNDGTWERIFVYVGFKDKFKGSRLLRKTRSEAIQLLQEALSENKIEGWFLD